jgi:hypothetical protein
MPDGYVFVMAHHKCQSRTRRSASVRHLPVLDHLLQPDGFVPELHWREVWVNPNRLASLGHDVQQIVDTFPDQLDSAGPRIGGLSQIEGGCRKEKSKMPQNPTKVDEK